MFLILKSLKRKNQEQEIKRDLKTLITGCTLLTDYKFIKISKAAWFFSCVTVLNLLFSVAIYNFLIFYA